MFKKKKGKTKLLKFHNKPQKKFHSMDHTVVVNSEKVIIHTKRKVQH